MKILILEDSNTDVELIQYHLGKAGMKFQTKVVSEEKEFKEALEDFSPDIILSDHSMPRFNSIEALKIFKETQKNIPFILVTGSVSEEFAVQSIKEGASDYILKDRMTRLPSAITNALEKCHLEEERLKYLDEVIQRNKDLEQFTYIVSHNLRAPVANIIGFADVLRHASLEEIESGDIVSGLTNSVRKLDSIIIDLNNVLQIKHNISEKKEWVYLLKLVDDIKLSIAQTISKEKAAISTNFKEVGEIRTVKSYLYSIFYNLILNSIKFRRPEIPPIIEIGSIKRDSGIILTFKDNGLGIDLKKYGDQLFGLYKRFHPHIEGKGMGLFMVKTQVETLGGKIRVDSELGKGTEFLIEFND